MVLLLKLSAFRNQRLYWESSSQACPPLAVRGIKGIVLSLVWKLWRSSFKPDKISAQLHTSIMYTFCDSNFKIYT